MRPIVIAAIAVLFTLLSTLSAAQSDIDRAFEMQNAPVRSRLTVDGEVKEAQGKVQNNVAERYTAKERARAEEMRSYGSTEAANAGSQSASPWTLESTRKVAAVSWHAETYVRCTGARNKGETFNILHLDNGRYQSVTGPTEATIKKVADFHCK